MFFAKETHLIFGDIKIKNSDDTFSTFYFRSTSITEKHRLRPARIHCHGLLSLISNNDTIIYGIACNSKLNVMAFTEVA